MTFRAIATRHRALVGLVAAVTVVSFTITPMLGSIGHIPLTEGFWFISGPYSLSESGNTTYSVLIHGVDFTFMYYINEGMLDVPYPVHFEVTFPDSLVEELVFYIGGWGAEPHISLSNHIGPITAVFKPTSYNHESHYSWFLAVEIQ